MGTQPIRLPLSPRQAEALAKLLDEFHQTGTSAPTLDEYAALREVADKLDTLKDQR